MAKNDTLQSQIQGASPLVKQIIALILDEIDELEIGKPLLPETKLAEKFGVSRKTIRNAMHRLEENGLVRRIKRKGTFPTQGRNVKSLFRKQVKRIGLIVHRSNFLNDHSYQKAIVNGVCTAAIENSVQTLLAGGVDSHEFNDSIFRLADDKSIAGIILIGITDQQLLLDLEKWNKPICLIDHYSNAKSIDCVRTDSSKGSQLAIEHLHRLGHRKISYANYKDPSANPARLKGFHAGLKTWKLPKRKEWIFQGGDQADEAETIVSQYLSLPADDRPSAIIAFSGSMAEQIKDILSRFGLNIPGDLSVIGTKGSVGPQAETEETITNICYDWKKLGLIGFETLLDRILEPRNNGENILIPPVLEVGDSTAALQ